MIKGHVGMVNPSLLERYLHVSDQIHDLERQRDDLKNEIKSALPESGVFLDDRFEVVKRTQTRTSIVRAQIPSDLWEKYSTITQFDTLVVKLRKKKNAS